MRVGRWITCGIKNNSEAKKLSLSPTEESAFPSAPAVGTGDCGISCLNPGCISTQLGVPQSRQKAIERMVAFEGGESGHWWHPIKLLMTKLLNYSLDHQVADHLESKVNRIEEPWPGDRTSIL